MRKRIIDPLSMFKHLLRLFSMKVLSFDIGIKNFAQYIETYNDDELLKCDAVSKVMNVGVCNHISVHDLVAEYDVPDKEFTTDSRKAIISHLDSFEAMFRDVDTVLIEQQYFNTYSFGKKKKGGEANVKAIKIAEDVLMWFLIKFPSKKIIVFPSVNKTQLLGAPLKLTKPQRKKWSTDTAMAVFQNRGDISTVEFLKREKKVRKQKLDDMCDAMMQCQAYKYKILFEP